MANHGVNPEITMNNTSKFPARMTTLGYDSFYRTKDYHIVNDKSIHNQHEMSIQLNE